MRMHHGPSGFASMNVVPAIRRAEISMGIGLGSCGRFCSGGHDSSLTDGSCACLQGRGKEEEGRCRKVVV